MVPTYRIPSTKTPSFLASRRFGTAALVASIITVGIGTFGARNANAYALEGPKWPNGSNVVMQLSLGNAGQTLADGNTSWNTAVAPALDMWNGVIGGMQFGKVMNSTASVSRGDGLNSMVFASTVFGQSFGSNTLAVTYYSYSGSTFLEADILFNNAQSWDSYRGALRSAFDIQRVALHESGHALGLDHPDQAGQDVSAIMNSVVSDLDTLTSDDIAGAQSLYGAASPTPTPTPSPTATPTATPTPTPSVTPTPTPTPSSLSVSLSVAPTSIRSGGTAVFTVSASAPVSSSIIVSYSMSGSAVLGRQYSLSGTLGQVTIPSGASSANVTLSVLSAGKRSKSATMNLNSGTGYTLSGSTSASVSIRK